MTSTESTVASTDEKTNDEVTMIAHVIYSVIIVVSQINYGLDGGFVDATG